MDEKKKERKRSKRDDFIRYGEFAHRSPAAICPTKNIAGVGEGRGGFGVLTGMSKNFENSWVPTRERQRTKFVSPNTTNITFYTAYTERENFAVVGKNDFSCRKRLKFMTALRIGKLK